MRGILRYKTGHLINVDVYKRKSIKNSIKKLFEKIFKSEEKSNYFEINKYNKTGDF